MIEQRAINFGDRVRDRISGLEGIVISRVEFLYGCVRCSVQPEATKDWKPADAVYIDEPQLILVTAGVYWRAAAAEVRAAGPADNPVRYADPVR